MPSPPAPASPDGRCTGRCVRRRWTWRAGQAFNLQCQPSPSTRSRETAIRHVNVLHSSAPTLLGLFRRRIVCDPLGRCQFATLRSRGQLRASRNMLQSLNGVDARLEPPEPFGPFIFVSPLAPGRASTHAHTASRSHKSSYCQRSLQAARQDRAQSLQQLPCQAQSPLCSL